MNKPSAIEKKLSLHKRQLCSQFNVSQIGVFGSYARGEQRKGSDIDILVEFSNAPGLLGFIRLENRLEEILGGKVDLVRKKAIRPEFRQAILSEVVYV